MSHLRTTNEQEERYFRKMPDVKFCRICLDKNVRMHQIWNSEVQDVYEKLTTQKIQHKKLHFACYMCYCQLKKSHQLVMRSQKSEELLKQLVPIKCEPDRMTSILSLDRQTHCLINSLVTAKTELIEVPEYNTIIKTDSQSVTNEVIFKDEPLDDSVPLNNKHKLDENHTCVQDEPDSIECEIKETTGALTNTTANKNELLHIFLDDELIKDDNNIFICSDCGKRYDMKILIKHISGHEPMFIEPNVTYKELQKSPHDNNYTVNNDPDEDNIHYYKPYKCQYCNYKCKDHSNLKRHIRTHTGEKPFECNYCDFTCTTKNSLKNHTRTHTGEKPFKCKYCDYTCAQNSNLKIHIRIHTGEKPFKCQDCNYKCKESGSLKRHVRVHAAEKPFQCDYCSFACTKSSILNRHIKTHTGE